MADQDVKAISATGTFAVLNQDKAANARQPEIVEAGTRMPPPAAKPDLEKLTQKLNLASETIGRDLRFEVDMTSGRSVIQVLDRETGEIIRQIPPEKAQVVLTRNGFVELRLYDGRA